MELSPRLYQLLIRQSWFTQRYIHRVVRTYFRFDDKTVLDFGAGIGANCALFQPHRYLGLDPDGKRIEFAKLLHPGYQFDCLQGSRLPVPDKSTDYIFIAAVLHHIPLQSLTDYFGEFRRVLKPEGKIIVMEPYYQPGAYLSNWYMARFDNGKYILNEDGYLNLFKRHQYQVTVLDRFRKLALYNELFFWAERKN